MSEEHPSWPTRDEILAEQSGPRERVLDEHMYRVEQAGLRATFRLQLFTAAGLRPVAVAAQNMSEGQSLVNGSETFCIHVWHHRFPDQEHPPLWVQRLVHEHFGHWQRVTFDVDDERTLRNPLWPRLSQQQLDTLVGTTVDPDRGSGFVPWPQAPEYRMRYTPMPVARMPTTRPFRTTCMTGRARRQGRWAYQVLRRWLPLTRETCCWYHGGDWRTVNQHALRLLRLAESASVDPEDVADHVVAIARAEGLTE